MKEKQCIPKRQSWSAFVNEFIEDYFVAHPDFAVRAGRHDFDGKLPDWSAEGIATEISRLRAEKERVLNFRDDALHGNDIFERDYLYTVIDSELFWLESAEWPFRCPQFYADGIDPDVYVSREYASLEERLVAYIAYAKAVPTAAQQIAKNLLRTPLPKTYVQIGRTVFGGLASFYENEVPPIFAAVDNQSLQQELHLANSAAIIAMQDLDRRLESQETDATNNFFLGEEKLTEMLKRTEGVLVPLDELDIIGRRDLSHNQTQLKEACSIYAPNLTVQQCVARANSIKPARGSIETAREQLDYLKRFVRDKKIVTIPGEGEALVAEAPAHRRWNPAYISIPGVFEREFSAIYYLAPPNPSWSQAEREAYVPSTSSLLFTSIHEVWPGHFLQFLHAKQSNSQLGRLFVGYAFSEGWAHYAEEMMWESGLGNDDPEIRIGQLLEALLRNVRLVVSLALHTGQMSVEEAETMFREQAYQDPANAREQAIRGTFDPAYLNFTMGKLMIKRLREDWTSSRGGRQAWQAFHDEFLKYGGPQIPLVRREMLNTKTGSLF